MINTRAIAPFENCPSLDGYHCVTSSLAKVFQHYRHPLSEDMLLGLGAGMGFIYRQMKMDAGVSIFVGGRANNKDFFYDLGKRVGVKIDVVSTASAKKAEGALLEKLAKQEPTVLFGDMAFLPWFEFPQEYHFGGHTFVICGYDGEGTVLASDMDPKASGLKKGFYFPITLDRLHKARNSPYKPFPPKNTALVFDFSQFHDPTPEGMCSAIKQTVDAMLNPPIKNVGVKGLRHTAKEIAKWPTLFNDVELRMNLFNLYVFIEIGGTGGGCFRYMYARFLKEVSNATHNAALEALSDKMVRSGELLSEIGQSFKSAELDQDIHTRIHRASECFEQVADLEESVFTQLSTLA